MEKKTEFNFDDKDFEILDDILWEIEEFMCFDDNGQNSIDKLKDMTSKIKKMTM